MYAELDRRILDAVKRHQNPLYEEAVTDEAQQISFATKREVFRVIDGRLQAMRKAGRLRYNRNTGADLKPAWELVDA